MNYEFIDKALTTLTVATTEKVADMERTVIAVPVTIKGENGESQIVTRTLSNPVAVRAISDIEVLHNVSKMSLKAIVIAMSRITDEHAKSVGHKKAKNLIKAMFEKDYSENTISKYRRIGLIFGNREATGYEWRTGIDSDVSVSNLDAVLSLCECDNAEELTEDELTEVFNKFYAKYIFTDIVHLSASQTAVKKEVNAIRNPAIDIEYKEIEPTQEQPTQEQPTQEQPTQEQPERAYSESKRDTALEFINRLTIVFSANKTALTLLTKLVKEVDKLEE